MGLPCSRTQPSLGFKNPERIFKRVVFPQPLGPNIQSNSPGCTSKETPSSTGKKDWFIRYTRPNSLISRIGGAEAGRWGDMTLKLDVMRISGHFSGKISWTHQADDRTAGR